MWYTSSVVIPTGETGWDLVCFGAPCQGKLQFDAKYGLDHILVILGFSKPRSFRPHRRQKGSARSSGLAHLRYRTPSP